MLNEDTFENDHIYYNITIENPPESNVSILAEFSENRTSNILNKSDAYEMAVIRFNLPTSNIPIFIWDTNVWFISIKYLTNVFTREIPFIENQNLPNSPTFFGESIWHYQDFVDSINAGLLLCFQDFQADPVYLTIPVIDRPIEPPIMIYSGNGNTRKCSIYSPLEYDIDKTNPIYIYFSSLLFSYFPAFQNFNNEVDPILSHYLKIKDNRNNKVVVNTKNYLKLTEEWEELFLWNDFQKFLFETDSIPVANELLSGQKNITRKVLTDFEPLASINNQSNIQFNPQSSLRFYEMNSGIELRQIDMRVFWQTKDGRIYPLFISREDNLTIKIYFKKKGLLIENLGIF